MRSPRGAPANVANRFNCMACADGPGPNTAPPPPLNTLPATTGGDLANAMD